MDYIWLDSESPILNQVPRGFQSAAILLHPFVQMPLGWSHNHQESPGEFLYPSNVAPLFSKEILYRVLQGQHGVALEQFAIEGSSAYLIKGVIEHIMNHFAQSIQIEELAEIANMSVSSLHRHFKEVTAMSPIQFQKQLRLQDARHLLLSESADAAEVVIWVCYESPSQFSLEYPRMFGYPPKEDIKRLRANSIL